MRAAIYGSGAMGTILGAYLTRAKVDIVLVNRNKDHVDALNRNGAKIVGEEELIQAVRAVTPLEMSKDYDVIFLTTKQTENEAIAEFLRDKLSKTGVVCTIQNGLPEIKLMDILGTDRVIGAAAVWGATLEKAGVARLTSNPNNMSFQIGSLSQGNKDKLEIIKEILENMCPVSIEDNFIGARFSKLIINATLSGLSTVFGVTFGEVTKNRNMRQLAQSVIKETIDVAKAADIKIMPVQGKDIVKLMYYENNMKKRFANLIIPFVTRKHKNISSGMLYDIQRGAKTEIDAINGVVCEFGRRYSKATPFNDRIVEIVHSIEQKKYVSSIDNLRLFNDLM